MNWPIIANVVGFLFLLGAIATIAKVESAELGEHSSRFIATVLAVSAYYGATSIGGIVPELPAVKFEFLKYLVPIAGLVGLAYLAWKVYENWASEMESAMKSGGKLLLVVIFALLARVLLSL